MKQIIMMLAIVSGVTCLSSVGYGEEASNTMHITYRASGESRPESCGALMHKAHEAAERIAEADSTMQTHAIASPTGYCNCAISHDEDGEREYACSQAFNIVTFSPYISQAPAYTPPRSSSPPPATSTMPPVPQRSWLAEHPEAIYQPLGQ